MFAPAVSQVMKEYNSSSVILSEIVVSIYVLGFAVGPLFVAPLSEVYGRKWVYLISSALFLIFTVACAVSSSLPMLIVFRFLAGCVGSTPTTLGGATIGDMFPKEKRGGAMALWGMGPQLGPAIGPVIGGFLAAAKGWRWVFWLLAIVTGALLIVAGFILRETYAPVLFERRLKALEQGADNQSKSQLSNQEPLSQIFTQAIARPLTMLFTSPIVFFLSLYTAMLFGELYLFITTFPTVFQDKYHFSTSVSGLAYLGLGVGAFLGLVLAGKMSDPLYKTLTAKNNGVTAPEYRLPPLLLTSPLVAIAFFAYGWSVQEHVHWIAPIIFTAIFSMGMMPAFVSASRCSRPLANLSSATNNIQISVNMYLVETFGKYSASALAASKVLQSVVGAFLPLAGLPLYDNLGYGWGNSLLGFVALAFIPIPWLFYRYGAVLRGRMASNQAPTALNTAGRAV